jgi:diacylglycerol O-acyltransferase / wax synthase
VRLEHGPGLEALRASIVRRLGAAPALTRRLGGTGDAPAWVPDDAFDIAEHVVRAPVGPVDDIELRAEVARLFEQHLDRARPLWRIDAVQMRDGDMALVWRLHHALADGTAAMRYARLVLWDEPEGGEPAAGTALAHAHAEADDARRRGHLARFLRREFARAPGHSPFDGRVGRRRSIAFATAPLHELHDAARAIDGATLNDAVLAIVAGALRRWIEHHHGRLGAVRCRVPVSLHHEGDDAGNHDSYFCVPLPLNEPDCVARLSAVREATAVRKAEHDAETMDHLLRDLSRVSPRLEAFCVHLEDNPRRFAVSVSNLPGPRRKPAVLGAPVRALHTIAEIGERHALRVSVVSMAGTLCFGFCGDPAIVEDVGAMAEGVAAEVDDLTAAAA